MGLATTASSAPRSVATASLDAGIAPAQQARAEVDDVDDDVRTGLR